MKPPVIRKKSFCALTFAAGLVTAVLTQNAPAGLILQDQSSGSVTFPDPLYRGQTFTAEDPFILTIGIGVVLANPGQGDRTLTMNLYSGRGISGDLLGTRSLQPALTGPSGTIGWVDFNFSGVQLIPGEVYSFTATAASLTWAMQFNQWALLDGTPIAGKVDYVGGESFTEEGFRFNNDRRFRVIPVPEPGTNFLIVAGLSLVSLRAFQRARK